MLAFVRAQDSYAKFAGYSPCGSARQQQKASGKIRKFTGALKIFLEQNTAYDIAAYRYFEGFDERVAKPAEQAANMFEALEANYAK